MLTWNRLTFAKGRVFYGYMAQHHPRAKALLEKFHAGQCTPEEIDLLNKWYDQLDSGDPVLLSAKQSEQYQQQFLATYRRHIPGHKITWIYSRRFKWVAAASIIILAWVGYNRLLPGVPAGEQITASEFFHANNRTDSAQPVLLPDSTLVWLNAGASLSWKSDYDKLRRRVTFTGEGYFDVRTNAAHPFIVDTRDLRIEVLGTVFNLEAYDKESITRVALAEGRVLLQSAADSAVQKILRPGYAATLLQADSPLAVDEVDITAMTAWRSGGFSVKDLSVQDAIQRLCTKHGYTVQWINKKNIAKKVSIVFDRDLFEQTLGSLCYMVHKEYLITGNEVTIY